MSAWNVFCSNLVAFFFFDLEKFKKKNERYAKSINSTRICKSFISTSRLFADYEFSPQWAQTFTINESAQWAYSMEYKCLWANCTAFANVLFSSFFVIFDIMLNDSVLLIRWMINFQSFSWLQWKKRAHLLWYIFWIQTYYCILMIGMYSNSKTVIKLQSD